MGAFRDDFSSEHVWRWCYSRYVLLISVSALSLFLEFFFVSTVRKWSYAGRTCRAGRTDVRHAAFSVHRVQLCDLERPCEIVLRLASPHISLGEGPVLGLSARCVISPYRYTMDTSRNCVFVVNDLQSTVVYTTHASSPSFICYLYLPSRSSIFIPCQRYRFNPVLYHGDDGRRMAAQLRTLIARGASHYNNYIRAEPKSFFS